MPGFRQLHGDHRRPVRRGRRRRGHRRLQGLRPGPPQRIRPGETERPVARPRPTRAAPERPAPGPRRRDRLTLQARRQATVRTLPPLLGRDAYAAAAADFTAPTISRTSWPTSFSSSPSAITRISGSVPEARTNTRPEPFRRASAAAMAEITAALSRGLPPLKRTFSSFCGTGWNWRASALTPLPPPPLSARTPAPALRRHPRG